jgi:hypothetical protein
VLFLSQSDPNEKLLVYVQASPVLFPSSARKFSDLETAEFRMSHSSKTALAFAGKNFSGEIVAAGFSPILREAVARGASRTFPTPLCDDPLRQFSFFPKEKFSAIILGENPDWLFSGLALGGVISATTGLKVQTATITGALEKDSVTVILDSGAADSIIDIRRIEVAQEADSHPEGVLGLASIKKAEEVRSEALTGSAEEISSILSRRLQRMTKG